MEHLKIGAVVGAMSLGLLGVVYGALLPSDVPFIECEDLYNLNKNGQGAIVVDVRAAEDYRAAHISGAVSVPFYKLPRDASWPRSAPLVLYCEGKGCPLSGDSALALMQAGYTNVKVLNGGIREWMFKEYPVITDKTMKKRPEIRQDAIFQGKTVTAKQLAEKFQAAENLRILDLRTENEYEAAHLPGSKNVPLEKLQRTMAASPENSEFIVYDKSSERSGQAVGLLNEAGFPAHSLLGGVIVWAAAGYPLAAGKDHEK